MRMRGSRVREFASSEKLEDGRSLNFSLGQRVFSKLEENVSSMKPRVIACCLAFVLLAAAPAARAEDPGWIMQGEGGIITSLVIDPLSPSTLYAATARGIFK